MNYALILISIGIMLILGTTHFERKVNFIDKFGKGIKYQERTIFKNWTDTGYEVPLSSRYNAMANYIYNINVK